MNEIIKVNPASMKIPTKAYSNGVLVPLGMADMLFVTGQLAQDIDGNVIAPNDATEQARYILGHISDILADAQMSLQDIVKIQVFVSDMAHDGSKVSKVRDEVLAAAKPASTMIEVSRFVKDGCCVEIEAIAVKLKK